MVAVKGPGLVILWCAVAVASHAQTRPAVVPFPKVITSQQRAELFAVLDKLGYREALAGPVYFQDEYHEYHGYRLTAWDFMVRTPIRTPKAEYIRFNLRVASLYGQPGRDNIAPYPVHKALNTALEGCKGLPVRIFGWVTGFRQPTVLDAIIWARFADLHGESLVRDQFIEAALRMNLGQPLHAELIRLAGRSELWVVLCDFADPRIPWKRHKAALNRFLARFPVHAERAYAQGLIRAIDETAVLDRVRAKDTVGKLIDQLAHEPDMDWLDWPNGGQSPAVEKLLKLGHRAVPKLIAALDDRRLVHELREKPWFEDSLDIVYRVQTRALHILEYIASKDFGPKVEPTIGDSVPWAYDPDPPFLDQDAWIKQAKKNVLAWWASRRTKPGG